MAENQLMPGISDAAERASPRRSAARGLSEGTFRRLAWLTFAVIAALYVVGLAMNYQATGPQTSSWGTSGAVAQDLFELSTLTFPVVGILIVSRHPRNKIGWICLAVGMVWAWDAVLSTYASIAPDASRKALATVLDSWLWIPAITLMAVFLILLFPDGHLPSPRWRTLAWIAGVTMVLASVGTLLRPGSLAPDGFPGLINPIGIESLDWLWTPLEWLLVVVPASIVAAAVSLVLRFRRSRGRDRLQLKWLAGGAVAVALISAVAMTASLGFGASSTPDSPTWVLLLEDLDLFSLALIPAAIGVAILKHRLYDIDIVINKTVVFGGLAVFITAVYVAIVVGIGNAIGSGTEPNLALSIAATAIVAVAFEPVRARVQRFANRLVYGKRATPYEVLSRFAQTIASSYGAEELLPRTAETLREATAAAAARVWLVVDDGLVLAASSPPIDEKNAEERSADLETIGNRPGERSAPIIDGGELLGALTIAKSEETIIPADQELLDNLASQAAQIVRNARLTADLQTRLKQLAAQAQELRRSRQRIVAAQDDERRALERNIHDGAQQHLVALAVKLKLTKTLATRAPERAMAMLDQLRTEVGDSLTALRELASGIYPAALEEGGIAGALQAQVRDFSVVTTIDADGLGRYPLESEATVYFCCLEALQNVAKYAHANRVSIQLRNEAGSIYFRVQDDGIGFDPVSTTFGSGLRNISDRVGAARGSVDISSAPGAGTTIAGRIPIKALQAVR